MPVYSNEQSSVTNEIKPNITNEKQETSEDKATKLDTFSEESEDSTMLKGYLEYDSENDTEATQENANETETVPEYIQQAKELEASETAVGLGNSEFKKKAINIKTPPKFATKSLLSNKDKTNIPKDNSIILDSSSKFSNPEYWINPISTSIATKSGKFSVGTSYYSGLDSASLSSTTGIFTRYDGKHFAISTSFSKSSQYNDSSCSDSFAIAPEIKITKRLSFVDSIQTNVNQVDRKNKMVLRYNPKLKNHEDDVQLEFGVGQSFYENQYVKSSITFSTQFKL